jgi:hypothetical protein
MRWIDEGIDGWFGGLMDGLVRSVMELTNIIFSSWVFITSLYVS